MSTSSINHARPWPYGPARPAADPGTAGTDALAGAARLVAAVLWEYRARRAARHLLGLGDHLLRDIGLGRGEVERAVWLGRDR